MKGYEIPVLKHDIIINMKRKKPLSETNHYLKDPEIRKKLAERSVRTSSGVEGIKLDPNRKCKYKITRK